MARFRLDRYRVCCLAKAATMIIWLTITAWFSYAGYVFLQPRQKRPPGFRGVHYLVVFAVSLYCVYLGRELIFSQANATLEAADKPAYTDDEIREVIGLYKWESYRDKAGWDDELFEWIQETFPPSVRSAVPYLLTKNYFEANVRIRDRLPYFRRDYTRYNPDLCFSCRMDMKIHKDERIELYVLVDSETSKISNPGWAKWQRIYDDWPD